MCKDQCVTVIEITLKPNCIRYLWEWLVCKYLIQKKNTSKSFNEDMKYFEIGQKSNNNVNEFDKTFTLCNIAQ